MVQEFVKEQVKTAVKRAEDQFKEGQALIRFAKKAGINVSAQEAELMALEQKKEQMKEAAQEELG